MHIDENNFGMNEEEEELLDDDDFEWRERELKLMNNGNLNPENRRRLR
jgi:hypothetical protein